MIFLLALPALLSLLALAAHFLREGTPLLSLACLLLCYLLTLPKPWVRRLIQGTLLLGVIIWIQTTRAIVHDRLAEGRDWKRPAIIFLCVTTFTLLAAALFQARPLARYYNRKTPTPASTV